MKYQHDNVMNRQKCIENKEKLCKTEEKLRKTEENHMYLLSKQ